jgi:hypothetical protein
MLRHSFFALLLVACAAAGTTEPRTAASPEGSQDAEPRSADFAAERADLGRLSNLGKTRELYLQFLERAEHRSDMSEASRRARERLADVDQEIDFLEQGIAERRLRELGNSTR